MSADPPVKKFASRRPDWEPRQLDLDKLQLHPFDALEQASFRQPCPKCQKSRFLYCYDCAVPFTAIPSLQLPFQVSIITHHAELASKNTGVHAAILCPEQVQMHSIDEMPRCDPAQCVVMFPSDDAVLPGELDVQQLQRVVIIDSKWAKAKELNDHPALQGMKRVKLPGTPKSCFWRFHTSGVADEGVCTVEALHLLLQAMAAHLPDHDQPHSFDNLLWYFAFQHQLVAKKAAERQQQKQHQEEGTQQQSGLQQQQQRMYPLQQSKKKRKQQQQQEQQRHSTDVQQQQQQHCGEQQQDHVTQVQAGGVEQQHQQQPGAHGRESEELLQHSQGAAVGSGSNVGCEQPCKRSKRDHLHNVQ